MINRFRLIFFIILIMALTVYHVHAKPTNPFQGKLTPEKINANAGEEIDLVLELKLLVEMSEIEIETRIPDGMELLSGQEKITVKKPPVNDSKKIKYRVKINRDGEMNFIVVARQLGLKDSVMSNCFLCEINKMPDEKNYTLETDSKGKKLRVVKLKDKKSEKTLVENTLKELFVVVNKSDYKAAAELIVYRGKDKNRKWSDKCNIKNDDEKNHVQNICQKIKTFLMASEKYEFTEFIQETESEGKWNVVGVKFIRGEKSKKKHFAFLEINGKYLLGDID